MRQLEHSRQITSEQVFYFLDAFKRFDAMTPDEIRNVALAVVALWPEHRRLSHLPSLHAARKCRGKPEEKYELRAIPNRKFSGLHLMCLMYAGFKRISPEHDLGMDLNDPFLTAIQLHERGRENR